jgi:tripeptidyl-peptidase-1
MQVLCLFALCTAAAADKTFTFFLNQPNAKRLVDIALDVADPKSINYGAFLSFEEVVALQQPAAGHLDLVHAYLDRVGATARNVSVAGDKVTATLPANSEKPPMELTAILDGVMSSEPLLHQQPVQRAARPLAFKKVSDDPQSCLSPLNGVNPECLRKAYGIGSTVATSGKNSQAVIVNEGFSQSDLGSFLSANHLSPQPIAKLVGQATSPGNEGSLDVQYITAMGSGTPTWWVYIDGSAENPFASWLTYMSNNKDIPLVQSLSVGAAEGEVGDALIARMNAEIAALGARGVTVLFASGDSGYKPQQKFGAASPFVTAVGGVWRGEMGSDDFISTDEISTGGFSSSDANPIQKWQEKAVASFLKTKGKKPDKFNASRRCVPDLASFDDAIETIVNGASVSLSGTSAAAPAVAGMFSLINDALLNAGHSPLGFANPFLYANEGAFLDIVHGNNGGPGQGAGFDAVPGYDPASGLGSFAVDTFSKLKTAALAAKELAASRRASKTVVV